MIVWRYAVKNLKMANICAMKRYNFLSFKIYDVTPVDQQRILQVKYCGGYEISTVRSSYNALHIKFFSRAGQFELQYNAGGCP